MSLAAGSGEVSVVYESRPMDMFNEQVMPVATCW